jgi:hypothetical protein
MEVEILGIVYSDKPEIIVTNPEEWFNIEDWNENSNRCRS